MSDAIFERLDEFTNRQGIVSAEWCKLLDFAQNEFRDLESKLSQAEKENEWLRNKEDMYKGIGAAKSIQELLNGHLKKERDELVEVVKYYEPQRKYHGYESSKYGYVSGEIINDNGDTARECLKRIGELK